MLVGLGDADPHLKPIQTAPGDPLGNSTERESDALAGVTSNLGADIAITDDVTLGADWYQRWNGDNAGQLGFKSALSDTGTVYVRERIESRATGVISTTAIGAEDRIEGLPGSRTYGEYQLENGVLGHRNRAVLGLGHRWQIGRNTRLSTGLEHQQVFGGFLPDGTPIGNNQRNVIHAGADYVRPDQLKVRARVELRADANDGSPLALQDGRRTADPGGFADHGAANPGAIAALPVGERWQVVAGLAIDGTLTADHTLFGRLRGSHTSGDFDGRSFTEAQYMQATAGWAYRPRARDWLSVLGHYSFVKDLRPDAEFAGQLGGAARLDSHAHVVALMPLVDLPWRLSLAGKLAWKQTQATSELASTDEAASIDSSVDALLWLIRLGYRWYGNWDAGAEVRGLHLWRPQGPSQTRAPRESKLGALLEVGYNIDRYIRLGVGYNLSRFSDDELRDLERDSHGFFVRVTGHY